MTPDIVLVPLAQPYGCPTHGPLAFGFVDTDTTA